MKKTKEPFIRFVGFVLAFTVPLIMAIQMDGKFIQTELYRPYFIILTIGMSLIFTLAIIVALGKVSFLMRIPSSFTLFYFSTILLFLGLTIGSIILWNGDCNPQLMLVSFISIVLGINRFARTFVISNEEGVK